MSKVFIIYYSWPNTSKNHAGMTYLVNNIKKTLPNQIRLIEMPQNINKWNSIVQRLHSELMSLWLRLILSRSDVILFMEYLGNCSGNQTRLAQKLRLYGMKNKFIGLVHLSGDNLLEIYKTLDYIKLGAEIIDNIVVFGSSLARFFANLGYEHKVKTTFHYVDTDFYKPSSSVRKLNALQVIHMGSLKRNFRMLKEIVEACPDIEFHICQGNSNLSDQFQHLKNVKLYGYLPESELLKLMQSCHVSLNLLDDTVGSNVITTSMACGLVNVVTEVGSIKDYCNENNSILIKSTAEADLSLHELGKNNNKIKELSLNAISSAQKINLKNSLLFFKQLLTEEGYA